MTSGRRNSVRAPAGSSLDALINISRVLAGKLDLQRVLAVALGAVAEVARAEGASILLIDPQTQSMSFNIAAGAGAEKAKTVPVPAGEGICGEVARTGEPLIVNDAQNDPRLYRRVDQATTITTRNLLCVPLRSGERLWGVLELINKCRKEDFNAEDLRFAEVAAAQIALAFENAHLHGEIVRKERMAAIGKTVSGLAHCVKNILNGIRSGSAVIERSIRKDDFPQVREGWNVVHRNNEMLSNLVLDMLSLARDSMPHPFPTDINDLTDQVCHLMTDRAAERGITIDCKPAGNLEDVLLDPTHVYRCLLNLVSNAVDACKQDGHVRVSLCRGNGRNRFTISVTDNGEGMSAEIRRKLFSEFFTTKGGRGTGLGLPVTKKLVDEMGGTITFHTVLGRGTRFVIALPTGTGARES